MPKKSKEKEKRQFNKIHETETQKKLFFVRR